MNGTLDFVPIGWSSFIHNIEWSVRTCFTCDNQHAHIFCVCTWKSYNVLLVVGLEMAPIPKTNKDDSWSCPLTLHAIHLANVCVMSSQIGILVEVVMWNGITIP